MAGSNDGALSVNAEAGASIRKVAPAKALTKAPMNFLDRIFRNSRFIAANHTTNVNCEQRPTCKHAYKRQRL
jgi:hypothetical protein